MQSLDAAIARIVQEASARLSPAKPPAPARLRALPSREEQLRMEFALSVVDFLPSGTNLLAYDLASNPHLPYVLSEDEPWKCALAIQRQDDTLRRHLPKLRLDLRFDDPIEMPEWAAA
jgi:hypothetical protein